MRQAVSTAPPTGSCPDSRSRPPATVVDVPMWRHGVALAERHRVNPLAGSGSGCADAGCRARRRGCWVRPVAERLVAASSGSWVQRWTARLDARSCGLAVPDDAPPRPDGRGPAGVGAR